MSASHSASANVFVVDAAFADGLLDEIEPIDTLMCPVDDTTSSAAPTTHESQSAGSLESPDGDCIGCPQCDSQQNSQNLRNGTNCQSCGERLVSNRNGYGVRFNIGEDIFFVAKCGPPFEGSVASFPDDKTVEVSYKDSAWKSSTYNEIKNIDDIAHSLDELLSRSQRRGRNSKVERFADIQLKLRDGEKEPCPKCGTELLLKSLSCHKCHQRIRTKQLSCGEHLELGQDLYFRNKLGDMTAGVLVKILDNETVELQYKDTQWSLSRYNETHSLENVAPTLDALLQQVGSRKRAAPKDFATAALEQEREMQRVRLERAKELAEIRDRERIRLAEIAKKEKEREDRVRAKDAARAKLKLQKQRERERAREKKRQEKLKEREKLKRMDHYDRNRFKRLARAEKARKEKKKDKDGKLISTVMIVNNPLVPGKGGKKLASAPAAAELEAQVRDAKKQAAMLLEAKPCTLQLGPWVTDIVCANLHGAENEHGTFCFRPRERGRNINVGIKQMTISEVLRRVRFVEECSAKIHCGQSRLDRWEQRALCHYIYSNTQPHRMAKNGEASVPPVVTSAVRGAVSPARSVSNARSPASGKGAATSRVLKQLETRLKEFLSPPGSAQARRQRAATPANTGDGAPAPDYIPFGGKYRHHLAGLDCSGLTIAVVERVLWACPTTELEFFSLVQSYELLRSPMVPALLELINDFLALKNITPTGDFSEVLKVNKDPEALKITTSDGAAGDKGTGSGSYHSLPLHCALCPQLVQLEQERVHPKYTQAEFNKLGASFPLTVAQFIFALNVAYERCGGRARLEGCTPAQLTIDGTEGAHRTMYGRVNENLVQELVERTTMSHRDVFSDLGCGVGQTCLQVSATTGCRSLGYEIVSERCDAARMLLREFDAVLAEGGAAPAGTIAGLVSLLEEDFIKDVRVARDSTVILFNNFSKWFDADIPGKGTNYNREICTQLLNLQMNAHVFTLSELIAAKIWLPRRIFMAPVNSTSWQVSEDKRVPIHHYIKDSDVWKCRVCQVLTPNVQTDECIRGHVPRIIRALDGDESCSSYDEESSGTSSSDSDSESDSGAEAGSRRDSGDEKESSDESSSDSVKEERLQRALEEKLKKLPKLVVSATKTNFISAEELAEYRRQKTSEYARLLKQGYGIGAFSEADQEHIRSYKANCAQAQWESYQQSRIGGKRSKQADGPSRQSGQSSGGHSVRKFKSSKELQEYRSKLYSQFMKARPKHVLLSSYSEEDQAHIRSERARREAEAAKGTRARAAQSDGSSSSEDGGDEMELVSASSDDDSESSYSEGMH